MHPIKTTGEHNQFTRLSLYVWQIAGIKTNNDCRWEKVQRTTNKKKIRTNNHRKHWSIARTRKNRQWSIDKEFYRATPSQRCCCCFLGFVIFSIGKLHFSLNFSLSLSPPPLFPTAKIKTHCNPRNKSFKCCWKSMFVLFLFCVGVVCALLFSLCECS